MSDVFVYTSAVIALRVEIHARLRSRVGKNAAHRLRVDFEPLLVWKVRHVREHEKKA